MVVQPQLILLQKTLLNIEGLGRQLYPDLDLWQTAKPFLEEWFHERIGPKAKIKQLAKQFPEIAEHFPEMPTLIFQALDSAKHTKHQIENQSKEITRLRQQMEKQHDSTVLAILSSALLISAAVFFQ
jgi:ubiquinone biosynthesis protein